MKQEEYQIEDNFLRIKVGLGIPDDVY